MSDLTKIAVDAMGGDGSPKKIIDGIIHNHKSNHDICFSINDDTNLFHIKSIYSFRNNMRIFVIDFAFFCSLNFL